MSKSQRDAVIQGYGHVFSRNPIDRGEKERRDETIISKMAESSDSLFLPLRNLDLLVDTSELDEDDNIAEKKSSLKKQKAIGIQNIQHI